MDSHMISFLAGMIMPAVSLGSCGLALSQIWKGHPRLNSQGQMLTAWAGICALCGVVTNLLIPFFPMVYSAVSVTAFLIIGLLILNPADARLNRTVIGMRLAGETFCLLWLMGIHRLCPLYAESTALMGLFAMGQVFNFMVLAIYVLKVLQKQNRTGYLWLLWMIVGAMVAVELTLIVRYTLLAWQRSPMPERMVSLCYLATLLLLLASIAFFQQKQEYDRLLGMLRMREEARVQSEYETGLQTRQADMETLRQRCLDTIREALGSLSASQKEQAVQTLRALNDAFRQEKPVAFSSVPALNAMLAQKQAVCLRQDISMKTEIRFSACPEETVLDLCIITGNLLDNAIRAVSLLEPDRREIVFSVREIQNCLVIRTENAWDPDRAEDIRQTGCGHRILKELVLRYQGEFQAGAGSGGLYEARLILPLQNRALCKGGV